MTRDTGWFKSSRSTAGSNGCVEVRFTDDAVSVRDSKNVAGPRFSFTSRAWRTFLTQVNAESLSPAVSPTTANSTYLGCTARAERGEKPGQIWISHRSTPSMSSSGFAS